jgi:hypothetical protein
MKGNHFQKKGLAVGIIVLLVGTSVVTALNGNRVNNDVNDTPNELSLDEHVATGFCILGFVYFMLDDPGNLTVIYPGPSFGTGADYDYNGDLYFCAFYGGIYRMEYETGELTFIGGSTQLSGLTYDTITATWYGCSSYSIYTVDIATGATTLLGNPGIPNILMGLTCSNDGKLFALDLGIDNSTLYSIDKTNGHATVIGDTGYNFQGIYPAFDRDNGILYISGFLSNNKSSLFTCDTQTGACTFVGDFENNTVVSGLAVPYGNHNQDPRASLTWEPLHPYIEETILFNASKSYDPDGYITLYEWDWDNNGIYDESTPSPLTTHYWSISGRYPVRLRVTGSDAATDIVMKTITVLEPLYPPTIEGPHYGKTNTTYTFSLGTITDPNGDLFYCLWDWGDGQSGWLGPYDSGETITGSHAWSEPGNYTIKVKLKDIYGAESDWSAPFSIVIVQLKTAFFLGIFESINQTDDLIILQVGPFIVLPSNQIFYSGRTIVISKEYRGYFGTLFAFGEGGVAIP